MPNSVLAEHLQHCVLNCYDTGGRDACSRITTTKLDGQISALIYLEFHYADMSRSGRELLVILTHSRVSNNLLEKGT